MFQSIFGFFIGLCVSLFTNILNGFEIATGLGFGTFLLACSIFSIFVSIIRFSYSEGSLSSKIYNEHIAKSEYNPKHSFTGYHSSYKGKHVPYQSKHSK